MNEDKIVELKSRIEDSEKILESITMRLNKLRQESEVNSKLSILQSRLDSLSPIDEPNGYVFLYQKSKK
jgi:hypothetical protein